MTTYKEIKGTQIEVLASDPSNPADGQVWYNSTDNVLKGNVGSPVASWATGGSLNTGRTGGAGGAGSTISASIAFSGDPRPAVGIKTELYNGSNWTEVNDLNQIRSAAASAIHGTQTAALWFGGVDVPGGSVSIKTETEKWNGTNWTEVNDLNQGRYYVSGAGTNSSAIAFGGQNPTSTKLAQTELYNGTNWTEVNDLATAKANIAGAGADNTSALAFGGKGPPAAVIATNEQWNGTNWTEVGDLNTARAFAGGSGIVTSALCFGGEVPPGETASAVTESWNGSTWTEVNDLITARNQTNGNGFSNSSAISFGGSPGSNTLTQEYQGATTRTFTDG